ncbi:MAG: efflux RND transporter permease subunit [Candidatus Paceibacterota bacterium]
MMTILPSLQLVKVVFFEQSDVDFVIIEIEYPEGTVKEVTDLGLRRAEEFLYDKPYIEAFTSTVGSGSQFGAGGSGEKFANIFINLRLDRNTTSSEIVEALRDEYAVIRDFKLTVNQPSDGPPTGAALIVKFLGDDLTEITDIANQSAQLFKETDGVVNVNTSTNNNNTEYVLTLNRAKAAALGLDAFTVSQVLRSAVFGADATSITTLDSDIDISVKLNISNNKDALAEETNITSIDALERIELTTAGGSVPLSSVVDVTLRESSAVINHESQKRVVSVTADVREGVNARETQTLLAERVKNKLDIPSDVEISTGGGETEESNEAFLEMFIALIVGVVLMIGVLVLQFNSFLHTRYVLSILPYSLIGIMFGLAATQSPLSFPSMMGFIALSGIVVNNSILLIDVMNHLRRERPSAELKELVLDAAASRLRPIILTTITTVIGMIPSL